jgi:hypothetical protein
MSIKADTEQEVSNRQPASSDRPATISLVRRIAWFCWALTIALIVATLYLQRLNSPATLLNDLFGALVLLTFSVIGVLIASRRPENRIGWAIVIGTLLWAAAGFAFEYSFYGLLTAPGVLPIPLWMALLGRLFRNISFILVLFVVLLLFPDGHLPSPRWRKVAWFLAAGSAINILAAFFSPDFTDSDARLWPFSNPIGRLIPSPFSDILSSLVLFISAAAMIACVLAVVVRFRRSRGEERQQLKWLTYSSFLSGAILVVVFATILLNLNVDTTINTLLFYLLLLPIPVAVGIAVLKYRLYEIDLIINRTLVYVPLTGILAGLYSATVALMQKLFVAMTGEKSDAAIVITTLVLAALFTPVKNALQAAVDRRFKEAPDPMKKLSALAKELESRIYAIDVRQVTRRFLDEAVRALHAEGGALFLQRQGQLELEHTAGKWMDGEARVSIPMEAAEGIVGQIVLGSRLEGPNYSRQEIDALTQVASAVAEAISSAEWQSEITNIRDVARS